MKLIHMKQIAEFLNRAASSTEEALQIFDSLEIVDTDFMLGKWKGQEFPTGHVMDGDLSKSGWYGKVFKSIDEVSPLVFYGAQEDDLFFADPGLLTSLNEPNRYPVSIVRDQVETTAYKARLRMVLHRGKYSATMIYDQLPINDVFRKIDDNHVFGLMDSKLIDAPYFFILSRD